MAKKSKKKEDFMNSLFENVAKKLVEETKIEFVIPNNKKQEIKPQVVKNKKGKMSITQIKKMMEENECKRIEEFKKKEEEKQKEIVERQKKEEKQREINEIGRKEEEIKREAEELQRKKDEEERKKMNLISSIGRLEISKKKIIKNEEAEVKTSFLHKSPICCILGHVDTGKTKLLDKLRESNVQEKEAGGITQQIGATFFPAKELARKCGKQTGDLPGILIIDTPGHESFTNLRSRGSSICNLAILVVDILHGLEQQTVESIELLRSRKTPFIVALNKIDRLYGWKGEDYRHWAECYSSQSESIKQEFREHLNYITLKFSELGMNAALFTENPNDKKYISIVPTSAISGEGISDLVSLILELSEKYMKGKMVIKQEVECTILEIKYTDGFGYTLDVILSNGELNCGDKIGFSTTEGPQFTTIRTLLIPQHMIELRVKSRYQQVRNVRASLGVKIFGHDCENAIAGSRVYVVNNNEEEIRQKLEGDYQSVLSSIKLSEKGVHVVASTLGSLEALLNFLNKSEVNVSNVSIRNLRKKDLIIISSIAESSKIYGCILCFDTVLDKDIKEQAQKMGIVIFEAKIIYHLLDKYKKFVDELKQKEKQKYLEDTVFPVEFSIVQNCIFTKRSPLILGVEVLQGTLKINTPICTFIKEEILKIGCVVSIENNKKQVVKATKGQKVAIKIDSGDSAKIYGRDFNEDSIFYSVVTRKSIDTLKLYFKDELNDDHLRLLVNLKNKFSIV